MGLTIDGYKTEISFYRYPGTPGSRGSEVLEVLCSCPGQIFIPRLISHATMSSPNSAHLLCPICLSIPAKRVSQCSNGHIFCQGTCYVVAFVGIC
jgi:hypothetical protein